MKTSTEQNKQVETKWYTKKAKLLDIYFIPTHYPNEFASGKPADPFTKKHWKHLLGQILSSGSVMAFSINYNEILDIVQQASRKVKELFPEIL